MIYRFIRYNSKCNSIKYIYVRARVTNVPAHTANARRLRGAHGIDRARQRDHCRRDRDAETIVPNAPRPGPAARADNVPAVAS